ncbi:MAG: glycosyltransferase [Bacteroidota bacterium]|nr:glycosyltransferase [Bacteroidota bacterium]
MNQQHKISVLVPCYNAGKYIREAVDSILNQTYKNLEILLIDDGSTDETRSIINEYSRKDSRVVPVYNETNLGLIKTLNKGVELATGEYIARMDSDDISALNRMEVLYDYFLLHPQTDVVSAAYYYLDTQSKVIRKAYPKATLSTALRFVSFFCTPVNHPCVMGKTEVFKENKYDEIFIHSEDYELFSRLLYKGYKFVNLPEPLYYLRINPESVSHRFEQIQISTHMRISVFNIEKYYGKNFDYFLHKVMVNRISFDVPFDLMKNAINTLDQLRDEFVANENSGTDVMTEINDFLIEQKIDIYLQTLKCSKWFRKPIVIQYILSNINVFLSKRGRQYFRLKFNYLSSAEKDKKLNPV